MMRYSALFAACGFLWCIVGHAQTVSGHVRDAETGEYIPNAIVGCGGRIVTSNGYGYYSIVADSDSISYSSYGYMTEKHHANQSKEGRLDVFLQTLHADIDEVVVNSQSMYRTELTMARMSRHTVSPKDIKSNIAIFGESDAIKTLQNLPGVASAADGTVNLSVRGSSHDQNLILLDEAVVYNPSHALGLFSAFNPDAIANVDFYKGGQSAKYGGKLAAVVDMRLKEGNSNAFEMDGSVGNVVGRLTLQAPIVKNVGSMMIAGRYGDGGLANLVTDHAEQESQRVDDIVRFYDICVKTNWHLSGNDRLFASAYISHDKFKCMILSQDNRQEWGNKTATIRWNHIFSDAFFGNYTVTASQYKYKQCQEYDIRDFEWKAGQQEITVKADLDHFVGNMRLAYGVHAEGHSYNPGQIDPLGSESITLPVHLDKKSMLTGALYVNDEMKLGSRVNATLGLRFSLAYNGKTYCSIEPRAIFSYSPIGNLSVKASYVRTVQYDHMLTNSTISMPTDVWMPVSRIVKPQTADMVSLGVHAALKSINMEMFCEAYYKSMRNMVDYRDNANLHMNNDVDQEVEKCKGRSAGLETMVKYENKMLSAQASYTLSMSERQSDAINQGNWYYAAYDQRHNFSANAMLKIKRNEISVGFKYHTGGRATLPYTTFSYDGMTLALYTERNGYVLPDFHRLDASWSYHFKGKENARWHSSISFSVYNCYGRKNAYSVFVKGDQFSMSEAKGYMMYLYRWVPSLTYSFKFH